MGEKQPPYRERPVRGPAETDAGGNIVLVSHLLATHFLDWPTGLRPSRGDIAGGLVLNVRSFEERSSTEDPFLGNFHQSAVQGCGM